jgi:hypothetical protein
MSHPGVQAGCNDRPNVFCSIGERFDSRFVPYIHNVPDGIDPMTTEIFNRSVNGGAFEIAKEDRRTTAAECLSQSEPDATSAASNDGYAGHWRGFFTRCRRHPGDFRAASAYLHIGG